MEPYIPEPIDRRVVLRHMTGAYAGLWRIMGTRSQYSADASVPLPLLVPDVDFITHRGSAVLSSLHPRYALYIEQAPILS